MIKNFFGRTPMRAPGSSPAGAYSAAIRAGDFTFISGQVPRDLNTGEIVGTSVGEQTVRVVENIKSVLEEAGATLDDVVATTVYLDDIANWEEFDAAYRRLLRPPYPTRATIGVGLHGFQVEIAAVAFVGVR